MKVRLLSVVVSDQEKALRFYTEVLGFEKKLEIPMGEFKWLTVVWPTEPDGPQVVLESIAFPPAKVYQEALYAAGIPLVAFAVDDVHAEHARLATAGVHFHTAPTAMGDVIIAILDDTCGNLSP